MIVFQDCCKECKPPERSVGCHGHCKKYLESKESHEKKLEQDRRNRKGLSDADAVLHDSVYKSMKRMHTRDKWKRK